MRSADGAIEASSFQVDVYCIRFLCIPAAKSRTELLYAIVRDLAESQGEKEISKIRAEEYIQFSRSDGMGGLITATISESHGMTSYTPISHTSSRDLHMAFRSGTKITNTRIVSDDRDMNIVCL